MYFRLRFCLFLAKAALLKMDASVQKLDQDLLSILIEQANSGDERLKAHRQEGAGQYGGAVQLLAEEKEG